MCGGRNWVGDLPFAREDLEDEEVGCRCARRYGCGDSLAKVSLGKDRVVWGVAEAMVGCRF